MYRYAAALAAVALTGCVPTLLVPATGLRVPIIRGGQAEIDAGHVVDVTGWCGGGTRHIAGHRSTHGSVFASLPSLDVGDEITIYEDATAKVYRLDSVTRSRDCTGVWGDVVLQTSHPDGGAYLFHLDRL